MNKSIQLSRELLPPLAHAPAFARVGLGQLLAASFDSSLLSDTSAFPFGGRGRSLVMVADFGGHHRGQHFDTYSFLIMDPIRNIDWLARQQWFRNTVLPNKRRMSFKALNDGMRRRALIPFMRAAAGIEGCLIQFAVSKVGGSLFTGEGEDELGAELLRKWKPHVQERLMRVLHMSAFLLSGLSAPNQDILWVIDEDDIAANVPMLTDLTELFVRVLSAYTPHGFRHIRCGTTATAVDDTLILEDLTAIADLTTGALGEVCTGFLNAGRFPSKGLFTPLPNNLTWKSKLISSWMAMPDFSLQRHTTILRLSPDSKKTLVSTLKWEAYETSLVLPAFVD